MKCSASVFSALAAFTVFAGWPSSSVAQPIVLGSASTFAVLAGSGITVAGAVNSTVITGDIGTFSTPTITGLGNIVLNGTNHAGDLVTQAAKLSLDAAYAVAAGVPPTTTYPPIQDLGGLTLPPGIYNDPSSFAITGILKLDALGNPNAVWIFQAGSTLTAAGSSEVKLINGAQASNVFWQVGSSATLNGSAIFKGTILALTDITLITSATVEGRLLARNGFVALDTNTSALPLAAQTITFAAIAGHTACDAPFTLSPTASSGLAVTLAVTSGPATIAGNTVTLTGTGTVVLTASQAGDGTHAVALNVVQSFVVSACVVPLVLQTITFAAISSHTACDGSFTFVLPLATSGLPVTLAISGPALISGNTVTLTGAVGTVTLTATQAGNGTFAVAPSVIQSFVVEACAPAPMDQTITFAAISGHTACDGPFTFVLPAASSGLPVTLAVSGPATISGNTIRLTGAVGTVVIVASQAGDETFASASNVAQSFVVAACAPAPTAQTITFAAISGHHACDGPFTFVAPVASSGLLVTLAVSGPATVSGNTVTLTGALGTVVITASQAGNTTFAPAVIVVRSFAVGACGNPPVITSPFDVQSGGLPVAPNVQAGKVGTTFAGYQIAASGSPTSFTAINLPPGLAVNANTGAITGTPTVADRWFTTIRASNAAGFGDAIVIFEIAPAVVAPISSGPLTVAGVFGAPFSYTIPATNSPTSFAAIGLPAGLTLNALTGVISGTPTTAGTSLVTVASTNSAGTGTTLVTIVIPPGPSSRIVNFSARALSGPGSQALIVGFVVSGNGKGLLVRGIGPTLSLLGISNALADPLLTLFGPAGAIATNDDWQTTITGQPDGSLLAPTASRIGAFALPDGSKDAALLTTVNSGAYAASLLRPTGASGTALTEIYDTDTALGARLINVSARVNVSVGEGTLIAGFVIAGNAPKIVLIRGVGPTLTTFAVTGVLADPTIAVMSGHTQIASNDNWETGTSTSAQIAAAAAAVGAFALPAGSKDAALLLTLQPGAYTVLVTGAGNTSGIALIEIYDLQN